jgi:hypothetical protein
MGRCTRWILRGALLALACLPSPTWAQSQTAERLYQEACDAGDASSCGVFALMLETGDGVPRDLARAATLYQRACELGAFAGCANLGVMHESGMGVAQDIERARLLHALACQGGEPLGCERLAALTDPSAANAGQGRGRVRHSATGAPLAGTLVTLGDGTVSAISDSQGFFAIPDLPRGRYPLRADHVGYEVTQGQVDLPFQDELIVLLTPADIEDPSAPGSIVGRVAEDQGGALRNAEVGVAGQPNARALTDNQGRFALAGVEPGTHELQFALLGYESRSVAVVVHPGRTLEIDASLSTDAIEMQPIEVVVRPSYLERNGFYQRQRGYGGRFFDRADLDEIIALDLSDVVRRVPGVVIGQSDRDFNTVATSRRSISWGLDNTFSPDGSGGGIFTQGTTRRSGDNGRPRCVLSIYVDGVLSFDPYLEWINVDLVEAVEVYGSGISAPALFTTGGNSCGAIVVWTRR